MKKSLKIVAIVLASLLVAGLFATALYEVYVAVLKVELAEIRSEKTLYIAHRGLSSEYYENTKEAFEAAAKSDFFYGIETDIYRTADGSYVCSHDKKPFRDQSKVISDLTLKECLSLPLKDNDRKFNDKSIVTGNERLCSFETYLKICKDSGKVAVIELKGKLSKEELKEFTEIVVQTLPAQQIMVLSFEDINLKRLAANDVPFGLMYLQSRRGWLLHNANLGYSLGVKYTAMDERMVKHLHGFRVAVNVWTVNDKETAQKYEAMGVDYITTDYDLSK